MGDLARSEGGVAGFEMEGVLPYPYKEFAGDDVEPLVLAVMIMHGGSAFFKAVRIIDEQFAISVFGRDLAIELTTHDEKFFLVSVFAAFDLEAFFWLVGCVVFSLRDHCGSDEGELKEETTVHIMWGFKLQSGRP